MLEPPPVLTRASVWQAAATGRHGAGSRLAAVSPGRKRIDSGKLRADRKSVV